MLTGKHGVWGQFQAFPPQFWGFSPPGGNTATAVGAGLSPERLSPALVTCQLVTTSSVLDRLTSSSFTSSLHSAFLTSSLQPSARKLEELLAPRFR